MREFRSASTAPLNELIALMERDDFDLIAVGRALIADPDWPIKVREGRYHDLLPFRAEILLSNDRLAGYQETVPE